MRVRRTAITVLLTACTCTCTGACAAPAAAAPATPSMAFLSSPALAAARLSGSYAVSGVVTTAVGIPGEAVGQRVRRSWTFISPCRSGACSLLGLRRQRAGGTDSLFLRTVAPGLYEGTGRYTAPVQCHGRTYAAGATVPYRLTVIVTAAAPAADGSLVATGFSATYAGAPHVGRTPCIQPPVHDAARYSGTLAGG